MFTHTDRARPKITTLQSPTAMLENTMMRTEFLVQPFQLLVKNVCWGDQNPSIALQGPHKEL